MNHEWLLDEISTGLQKIYPLSLDRTPAAEIIHGTALGWLEAITAGRQWNEARDAERVRRAFVVLMQTSDRWPSPKQFLAALPDSTQPRLAGPGQRPVDPPELLAAIEAAKRGDPLPAPATDERREVVATGIGPALADAERELRQHYGTDRKSAAAGDAS